jgi:hypothetical protein
MLDGGVGPSTPMAEQHHLGACVHPAGAYPRNMVVAANVYNAMFGPSSPAPLSYSFTHLMRMARSVDHPKLVVLDYSSRANLLANIRGGGVIIPAKVTSVTLMSVSTLARTMKRLGLQDDATSHIADSILAAKRLG